MRRASGLPAGLLLALLCACGSDGEEALPAPFAGRAAAVDPGRLERVVRALAGFGTRHTASDPGHPERGIGAAREWIAAELTTIAAQARAPMRVEEQAFTAPAGGRLEKDTEIVNVFAVLEGTDPASRERLVVVSAHYDSRASDVLDASIDAPGANDDASGVAVVLEMARIFAAAPAEATLVFLCVAGEEQGLVGSRHFARKAREDGWNVQAMITNDIVGNSLRPDGTRSRGHVRVFSEGLPAAANPMDLRLLRSLGAEGDSPSRQLARFVREQGKRHFRDFEARLVMRPDRFLRGGDHLAFNEAGFPAVRFTEPSEDYARQHADVDATRGDLPEFVDYEYLARVARMNAVVLAALAHAPGPPRRVGLLATRLEHVTTLEWETGPEPDLARYEVVWRDTAAAEWQEAREVVPGKDRTLATFALSKDDWHFGVRAVDEDGNRSPVAYPEPVTR